jgi:hypothetical protein
MGAFSLAAAKAWGAAAQGIGFRFQITGPQLIAGCLANLGQAIQGRDQRVPIRAQAKNFFEGPLSRGVVAQSVRALGQTKPGIDAAGVGFERRLEGGARLGVVATVQLILSGLQAAIQGRTGATFGLAAGG